MNFDNRTLFIADNLDIMRGMDSETIDLIYLDPPFIVDPENKFTFSEIYVIVYGYGLFNRFTQMRA